MIGLVRPTRDEIMMGVAHEFARLGTCDRLQVGAVIHRDSRVISTGYNGVPSGLPHCDHAAEVTSLIIDGVQQIGEERGCQLAVHAEANAIAWAARHGLPVKHCAMTVTHMPCVDCAKLIINAGICAVTFEHPYRKLDGVKLLERAHIRVVQYTP
jgi:dCMP deaminase